MRNICKILVTGAGVAFAMSASTASAATLIVNGSGQLTGATGVLVNGSTFNVHFVDGTCPALFDGCDAASDFTFQTAEDAVTAAQALLDQVFIDTAQGQFDSDPFLTFGCSSNRFDRCAAIIPFGLNSISGNWQGRTAGNEAITDDISVAGAGLNITTDDVLNPVGGPPAVFAVFDSAAAVPEPSTWAMMLIGFGAVGGAMRSAKRRQRVTVSYV